MTRFSQLSPKQQKQYARTALFIFLPLFLLVAGTSVYLLAKPGKMVTASFTRNAYDDSAPERRSVPNYFTESDVEAYNQAKKGLDITFTFLRQGEPPLVEKIKIPAKGWGLNHDMVAQGDTVVEQKARFEAIKKTFEGHVYRDQNVFISPDVTSVVGLGVVTPKLIMDALVASHLPEQIKAGDSATLYFNLLVDSTSSLFRNLKTLRIEAGQWNQEEIRQAVSLLLAGQREKSFSEIIFGISAILTDEQAAKLPNRKIIAVTDGMEHGVKSGVSCYAIDCGDPSNMPKLQEALTKAKYPSKDELAKVEIFFQLTPIPESDKAVQKKLADQWFSLLVDAGFGRVTIKTFWPD